MEICIIIQQIRHELGLTQQQLHVGFSTVNRWENEQTKPKEIARHALIELCKRNNVNPELILQLQKAK